MRLSKTRPVSDPYEVWQSPDGQWKWRVLKFYKSYENTKADDYARVFCNVTSPFVSGRGELGDVYYSVVTDGNELIFSNYGE